jgi:hypothetical protein
MRKRVGGIISQERRNTKQDHPDEMTGFDSLPPIGGINLSTLEMTVGHNALKIVIPVALESGKC